MGLIYSVLFRNGFMSANIIHRFIYGEESRTRICVGMS